MLPQVVCIRHVGVLRAIRIRLLVWVACLGFLGVACLDCIFGLRLESCFDVELDVCIGFKNYS
jgi:hypothetical protein